MAAAFRAAVAVGALLGCVVSAGAGTAVTPPRAAPGNPSLSAAQSAIRQARDDARHRMEAAGNQPGQPENRRAPPARKRDNR
jgi:hypothetical protein